uniref:protein FAM32A-like n=1 Tax=Agelaius phoeniceus TaxID=39638 RepID=UPI0023ECD209|nr:protein FAM32A-like [Agelaius phoeniceus]
MEEDSWRLFASPWRVTRWVIPAPRSAAAKGQRQGPGASERRKKKKKKKAKDKAQILEQIVSSKKQQEEEEEEEKQHGLDRQTPAQAAFEKMQEKRQMERILKKASKTHKQQVEEFNRHLDTLTEHHDFPKGSWTE